MHETISSLYDRFIRWWTVSKMGAVVLALALPGGYLAYHLRHPERLQALELVEEFYADLSPELVGIALTVLIIDKMYQQHEVRQERERLIRQLSSLDEHIAVEGLERLRAHGWLEDGVLAGVSLQGANLQAANLQEAYLEAAHLQNADLRRADLLGARLRGVHLQEADLRDANLHLADLTGAILEEATLVGASLDGAKGLHDGQLAEAAALLDATMPDGTRYDGRYRLPGDLLRARQAGYHVDDPTAMARFYVVPVDVYLQGQKWADRYLS